MPDVVLVDADLPDAHDLVLTMRRHPQTRQVPIAVLVRPHADPRGLPFLDAGANEILHLPAGPDWDERLIRVFRIQGRKEARFPFRVEVGVEEKDGDAIRATAVNLSARGLLVSCGRSLSVGDHLRVSFRLPGSADPEKGTGWVVREAAPGLFGVEFFYLENEGLERVRRTVESWIEA